MADELRQQLTDIAWELEGRADLGDTLSEAQSDPAKLPVLAPRKGMEPLTVSMKEAARILGLGRSKIYRLIGEGQVETVKIGNRTLVRMASVRELVGRTQG